MAFPLQPVQSPPHIYLSHQQNLKLYPPLYISPFQSLDIDKCIIVPTATIALDVLLAKVLEPPEPVGQARGLAVLARPRDAVEEHGGRDEADEDVEGCLYIADSGQPSFTCFYFPLPSLCSPQIHPPLFLFCLLFAVSHRPLIPTSIVKLGSPLPSHRYLIHHKGQTYAELLFHLGSCVAMVGGVAADLASH